MFPFRSWSAPDQFWGSAILLSHELLLHSLTSSICCRLEPRNNHCLQTATPHWVGGCCSISGRESFPYCIPSALARWPASIPLPLWLEYCHHYRLNGYCFFKKSLKKNLSGWNTHSLCYFRDTALIMYPSTSLQYTYYNILSVLFSKTRHRIFKPRSFT